MLRGENIACGDATTGTGTLTLAATPAGFGALDFRQWLTAVNGFATNKVLLVPYTIIEYTDSTFLTPSQVETGIGTLTLGASIGASTLARTTVQTTQTGSTYDESAPTALNIGVAANTLIFISANAWSLPGYPPYYDQSLDDAFGVMGRQTSLSVTGFALNTDGTGKDWYSLIDLPIPVFAKVMRIYVGTASSGGTPINTAFGRIYQVGTDGKPARLLVDFGTFGTNPLNSTGVKAATAATGMLLPPGPYWTNLYSTFSGQTTAPVLMSSAYLIPGPMQAVAGANKKTKIATGGSSTASDPANVTSWANGGASASGLAAGFAAS